MKIEVKTKGERKVVAYRGRVTGTVYLRASCGGILCIGQKSPPYIQSNSFSRLTSDNSHEPLYEGDVVEITL